MKTVEQIIEEERKCRCEDGDYGIRECKDSIRISLKWTNKSLYQLLELYVERANKDILFNNRMVLACWELINGIE